MSQVMAAATRSGSWPDLIFCLGTVIVICATVCFVVWRVTKR